MNQFQGHGRGIEIVVRGAQGTTGGIDQHRAQALATHQHTVAHGGIEPRRRGHVACEEGVQPYIDPGAITDQAIIQALNAHRHPPRQANRRGQDRDFPRTLP